MAAHVHSAEAWNWVHLLGHDVKLVFSRYTQIGLLRLLTNQAVMGERRAFAQIPVFESLLEQLAQQIPLALF